jgi:hypothetical protein
MKISPVTPLSAPSQDSQGLSTRNITMATSATPLTAEGLELSIPPTIEPDKTEPVVEATQPMSPQFAALAKQRRALQQERRAFEDERKAFEVAKQGSDAVPLSRLKSEPLRVLLESGVTYEQLTEAILNNQGNPDPVALEAKLKRELDETLDKRFSEAQEEQIRSHLASNRREAESLIFSSNEFELVKATKSIPDVIKLIERTYRDNGEIMGVPQALKLVEDKLLEKQKNLANLDKIQALYKSPEPQPQALPRPGMRTLTNKDTASVPMNPKQRALAAFYGTLKKG